MLTLIKTLRDITEALRKELLNSVEIAAMADQHHYKILDIKNFQAIPHSESVELNGELYLSGKQSGNHHVMRGLLDTLFEQIGYDLQYLNQGNCFTGNWFYTFELRYEQPEEESRAGVTQNLSLAWCDIEDITGYAIYEDADVPTYIEWQGRSYKHKATDVEGEVSDYELDA